MGSDVALQVERVVEALVTVAALVLLVGRVISPMSVKHSDVFETFSTNFTLVLSRRSARCLETKVRHNAKIFFLSFLDHSLWCVIDNFRPLHCNYETEIGKKTKNQ